MHLPLDVMFQLFDSMVMPILLFSCEVYGIESLDIIERVHLKFCKHILRLKKSTPNYMVYGESGRFPLSVEIKVRLISYWCKLVTGQCSKLSSKCYGSLLHLHRSNIVHSPWIAYVEQVLNESGLAMSLCRTSSRMSNGLKKQ